VTRGGHLVGGRRHGIAGSWSARSGLSVAGDSRPDEHNVDVLESSPRIRLARTQSGRSYVQGRRPRGEPNLEHCWQPPEGCPIGFMAGQDWTAQRPRARATRSRVGIAQTVQPHSGHWSTYRPFHHQDCPSADPVVQRAFDGND